MLTHYYTIKLTTTHTQHNTTLYLFIMASSSTDCCAIRLTWATEYGYGKWETGTVAYQCDKAATQGKFCGVCDRAKAPFGKIGTTYTWEDGTESTVPEYAAKDGKMDDGSTVSKGDALCCVFANPLIDSDGELLSHKKQELLDDDFWQCDKDDYSDDEDEDCDDEDEGCWTDDEDDTPVTIDKSITADDLREMCDELGIDHDGLRKSEMRDALTDVASDEKPKPKKAAKAKSPKAKSPKAPKKEKQKRAPSQYNLFMQRELPIYKEKHSVEHQVAFKAVAAMWTAQKDE